MGVSRVSHDPAKNYVEVQFNEDVSLLDSELNELQKIMRGSLEDTRRALLGVAFFGDEFKVVAGPTTNSITVKAGTLFYKGSRIKIYEDKVISFLTTPVINRTDCVFLEFQELTINSTQDVNILDPAVGAETSQRIKLDFVIRVVEGANYPTPTGTNFFVQLATLNRETGIADIQPHMIVDDRSKSTHTYVIEGCEVKQSDTFKVTVDAGAVRVAKSDMVVEEPVELTIPANATRYIVVQNDTVMSLSSRPLTYAAALAIVVSDDTGIISVTDKRDFIPLIYKSEVSAELEQLVPPPPPAQVVGASISKYKAGTTINQYKVVYLTATPNVVSLADNSTSVTGPAVAIAMQLVGASQIGTFMKQGEITNPAWTWTLNQPIFLGTNGDLTQTPPSAPYTIIQKVAFPVTAQTIEFNPSLFTIRN